MVKLVAIDLDETLLRSNNTVSEYTKSVIQRASHRGFHIVIATGRMYQTAKPVGESLGLGDIPTILYSGGVIQHILSGKIIWEHTVPLSAMEKVYTITRQHDWYIQAYIEDHLVCHHPTWQSDKYVKQTGAKPEFLGDHLYDVEKEANKLIMIDTPDRIEMIQTYMKAKLGTMVSIVRSQADFLEIIGPDVSKGNALLHYGKSLGVTPEEMVMFGNSENDISMLTLPGYAVAVGNAEDSVKAIADDICLSNEEDGVAHWIETHILEG